MKPLDVAIIGAGPAGLSAGIWAHSLKLRYGLYESAGEAGGQLRRVYNRIVDFAGGTAENGSVLARRFIDHASELGVSIRRDSVVSGLDLTRGVLSVGTDEIEARAFVLATGVRARKLGIPGEADFVGRGVSPSASRFAEDFRGRPVVVVGGGDAAFEEALILAEVCPSVSLVHHSDAFRARLDFRARVAANPRIHVIAFAELHEIEGADEVERVRIAVRGESKTLDVSGVFVCVGVVPNSELVAGSVTLDKRGYVVVDSNMRSADDRLYAVGDVRSGSSLTIAAAVGEAATAIKNIQRSITRLAG